MDMPFPSSRTVGSVKWHAGKTLGRLGNIVLCDRSWGSDDPAFDCAIVCNGIQPWRRIFPVTLGHSKRYPLSLFCVTIYICVYIYLLYTIYVHV